MPITPRFKLSQTETNLTITIHIPHIRVSASTIETLVDGNDFHFFSAPYLLYLSFPGRLLDDAETGREAKATYDPSNQNGVLTVIIWKEESGIWKDLDLLGNLVNRSGTTGVSSHDMKEKIKIISSTENETVPDYDCQGKNSNFSEDIHSVLRPRYGFLNKDHSVFTAYAREGLSHDMLEIPNPDKTPMEERRDLRLEMEHSKFDPDRYLADLFLSEDDDDEYSDMIYVEAMRFEPHWDKSFIDDLAAKLNKLNTKESDLSEASRNENVFFSEEESMRLMENKSQLLDLTKFSQEQTESLLLSLLDILYAYAYDHITTIGDASCESSWTIVMISPTLSWLESYTPPYDDISGVVRWSIRRALIYPYLRNFDFVSNKLLTDVKNILSGGVRVVLRCLLQIQKIFDTSEYHYLFNKLYINPYIHWVQKLGDEALVDFSVKLENFMGEQSAFAKSTLGLDLEVLERNAFEGVNGSDSDGSDSITSCSSNVKNYNGENEAVSKDDIGISETKSAAILDDEIGKSILNIGAIETFQKEGRNSAIDFVSSLDNNANDTKKKLVTEI